MAEAKIAHAWSDYSRRRIHYHHLRSSIGLVGSRSFGPGNFPGFGPAGAKSASGDWYLAHVRPLERRWQREKTHRTFYTRRSAVICVSLPGKILCVLGIRVVAARGTASGAASDAANNAAPGWLPQEVPQTVPRVMPRMVPRNDLPGLCNQITTAWIHFQNVDPFPQWIHIHPFHLAVISQQPHIHAIFLNVSWSVMDSNPESVTNPSSGGIQPRTYLTAFMR